MNRFRGLFLLSTVVWIGCGDDAETGGGGGGAAAECSPEGGLDTSVCNPQSGVFSLTIDNPFFPLKVGDLRVYDGMEDGAVLHLEIEVLDQTEVVAGVTTRVVEEREYEDGVVVEISRNFFAQAADGTVCYFGEGVDIYEGGQIASHDGAWRAEGSNLPGIIMPPNPAVGMKFVQEVAPGVAEDQATIVRAGETVTVPLGTYTDTIETDECTPLEPGHISEKSYARGVGLLVDAEVSLTSFMPGI